MNATEAIEYIHSVCWKVSVPGLGRTQALLEKMGNPEKKLWFVHFAGTNGKGSTAAMTASILRKAGYRTGLYTSPYIYRFHERMQVDGMEITDEELTAVTEYVKPLAQSLKETPTEFELVCCIAFEYFVRKGCEMYSGPAALTSSADLRCLSLMAATIPSVSRRWSRTSKTT